jgi:DNA adenine methylase
VLADLNPWLISTYEVVRDDVERLVEALEPLAREYRQADDLDRQVLYYRVRSLIPTDRVSQAARLIFLNKTCFNGLFRVNRNGQFNVPHGDYANPRILDAAGLRECSAALHGIELRMQDFGVTCFGAQPGDVVYLDPPYQPISATANFTSYTSTDFDFEAQQRLAGAFQALTERGVAAILSNSAHPRIADLYAAFTVLRVPMARSINSLATGRGPVDEFLIHNLDRTVYRSSSPK